MTIKVEQGHSLSQLDAAQGRGRRTVYPWRNMLPGESFLTDKRSTASAASLFARRNTGYKFAVRKVGENSWRVWRVEANG